MQHNKSRTLYYGEDCFGHSPHSITTASKQRVLDLLCVLLFWVLFIRVMMHEHYIQPITMWTGNRAQKVFETLFSLPASSITKKDNTWLNKKLLLNTAIHVRLSVSSHEQMILKVTFTHEWECLAIPHLDLLSCHAADC